LIVWRNTTIWGGLALITVLFVPAVLIMPRQALFEVMDAVCASCAVALCLGYAPTAWKVIRLPIHAVGLGQLLSVGLFLVSLSLSAVFGGLWAWRTLAKPDWIADSIPIAFSRWTLGAGLFTAILINWTTEGKVTIGSYSRSVTLVVGASLVAAVLIWLGMG
jgi:hypothetical protein